MRGRASAPAIGLAALLLCGGLAAAEDISRDSYREAVEPICRENTKANERILAGSRAEVRAGNLAPAAAKFKRAARALAKTLGELKAVPRPAADAARLSRWFSLIEAEQRLLAKTGAYLAAGRKGAALGMVVRLESTAARADNVVFAFEFHYCHFEPQRFT
jgi:hypothetical protein